MNGAKKYGIQWKTDSSENPVLSDCLTRAANEIGWDDPDKTLRRARSIREEQEEREEEISRAKRGRIVWHRDSVWVDGKPEMKFSYFDVASRLQKAGFEITGDSFHGNSGHDVPDEFIQQLHNSVDEFNQQANAAVNNPTRTQLWEPCEKCGTEPSYQTPTGQLCQSCRVHHTA